MLRAARILAVRAGSDGAVSVFASDDADVILDVDGYFAPPLRGGLSLYTNPPCRVLDTRPRTISLEAAFRFGDTPCGSTVTANIFVINATVVPVGPLGYLALWNGYPPQPSVSTLNALDGAITSNMAIVGAYFNEIDTFSDGTTNLIIDISGSFAP